MTIRFNHAAFLVGALCASLLMAGLPTASVASAAVAWSGTVNLTATPLQVDANSPSTTLNVAWGPVLTGALYVSIYTSTGARVACWTNPGGTTATITDRPPTGGQSTYQAYVSSSCPSSAPTGTALALSPLVTVQNLGYTGSMSLTTTKATTDANAPAATLSILLSKPLPWPYDVQIFDDQGARAACWLNGIGTTAAVSVAPPINAIRTYTAYLAQGGCTAAPPTLDVRLTSAVSVQNMGYTGTLSFSASAATTDANAKLSTLSVLLSKPLPSPYALQIFDDQGSKAACWLNGIGTNASVVVSPTLNATRTYTAFLAQGGCTSAPPVNDVRATSSVTVSNVGYAGTVHLSSDTATTDANGPSATLTATLSLPLAAPYYLQIFDNTGMRLGCWLNGIGYSASVVVTPPLDGTRMYTAYVAQGGCTSVPPTLDLKSTSSVEVANIGYTGSLSMTTPNGTPDANDPATSVIATLSKPLPSPFVIQIFDDAGTRYGCWLNGSGTTFSAAVRPANGAGLTLTSYLSAGNCTTVPPVSDVRATSVVSIQNIGYAGSISLAAMPSVTTAAQPNAVLVISLSKPLPSPYSLMLFDDLGTSPGCWTATGTSDFSVTVSPETKQSRTYTASIAAGGCAVSPPVSSAVATGSLNVVNVGYVGSVAIDADRYLLDSLSPSGIVTATVTELVPSPYQWGIYRAGTLVANCSPALLSCSTSAAPPLGQVEEYVVVVAQTLPSGAVEPLDVVGSDSVTVRTVPWAGQITLAADRTQLDGTHTTSVLTVTASQALPAGFGLAIYNDQDELISACPTNTVDCTTSLALSFGETRVFTAFATSNGSATSGPGDPLQESTPIVVTAVPAETNLDGVDLALVAAQVATRFADQERACLALGEVLPSDAVFHSSVPDVALECNAVGIAESLKWAAAIAGAATVIAAALSVLRSASPPQSASSWPAAVLDPESTLDIVSVADLAAVLRNRRDSTRQTAKSYVLTDSEINSIARRCILQVIMGRVTGPQCVGDTLFLPGAAAGGAADNDREAIASGAVARLHYVSSGNQGLPDQWWTRVTYPGYDAASPCIVESRPEFSECDEYPLKGTNEAGPASALNPAGPRLRFVPEVQNGEEGTRYIMTIRACHLQSGVQPSPVKTGTPVLGSAFIVIPMQDVLPVTAFVCGDPERR